MRLITGDETGLLKLVNTNERSFATFGEQTRSKWVKDISWIEGSLSIDDLTEDAYRRVFSVLRKGGELEFWRQEYEEHTLQQLESLTIDTQFESPVGVVPIIDESSNSPRVLAFDEGGDVVIAKLGSGSAPEEDSQKKKKNKTSEKEKKGANKDNSALQMQRGQSPDWSQVLSRFTVQGPLGVAQSCKGGGVAFGGKENDLKLYDANTTQQVWKAKNVGHDTLNLHVPVWITCMSFLKPEEDSVNGAHIATGTGHKHVRIYDTRLKRQPVISMDEVSEYRITAVQGSKDGNSLYVADASGSLLSFDMRTNRRTRTLKGSIGSIRRLSLSGDGKTLAATGLDRYVRTYDTKKNRAVDDGSVYLNNKVNACITLDEIAVEEEEEEEDEEKGWMDYGGAEEDPEADGDSSDGDDVLEEAEFSAGSDDDDEDDDDDDEEVEEEEEEVKMSNKKNNSKKDKDKSRR